MSTFTVERFDGFDGLPADLRAAFSAAEALDFQAGADWYALLCRTALSVTETPQLHVLRRDGAVAAALPLLLRQAPRGREFGALANFYTTRFTPALSARLEPDALAKLLRGLRDQGAAQIRLSPMDRTSPAFRATQHALRRAGFFTFDYFCFGNWYLPVRGDADAYLAARPGEVRSTLRRMSRRLEQAGGRIELVGPHDDVEGAIAAYSAVYATSWKEPEPYPAFMPGLIRLCAARGWLRAAVAWLGDKPIAAQVWVVANGKASIFKLAYDPAYSSYSPGTVLTARLMRQAIDVDRVREVDYLTGDDAYKQAWMSTRRELWGLVGYDPRQWRGAMLALREGSARALKRVLRRGQPTPAG